MSKIKIAVVTDLHFSRDKVAIPERIGHCADSFLTELIQILNASIKPDIAFLAGDLLDNGIESKRLYKNRQS